MKPKLAGQNKRVTLLSKEEIKSDFESYEVLLSEELEREKKTRMNTI